MVVMCLPMSLEMSRWMHTSHDDDDGDDDEDSPVPLEQEAPPLRVQREDCWVSTRSHSVAPLEPFVLHSLSQEGGSVSKSNESTPTSLTTSSWRVGPVPTPTTLSPASSSFGSRSRPIMVFRNSNHPNLRTGPRPPVSGRFVSLLEHAVPALPSSPTHLATRWTDYIRQKKYLEF